MRKTKLPKQPKPPNERNHQNKIMKGVDNKHGIYHTLNGILAKTRNPIFKNRFLGHIVDY